MSTERLVLSEKYKAFLRCDAPVEFLEGTTAAGKTTVGLFKFMCKVAESPKKLHIPVSYTHLDVYKRQVPVYMAQERRQTWIDAITYPSPVIPETRASQKMDALNM